MSFNGLVIVCVVAFGAPLLLGLMPRLRLPAGESSSEFGQLVVAAASVAEFSTVLALSLLFSREADNPVTQIPAASDLTAVHRGGDEHRR